MTNLFSRIKNVIVADLNEAVERKEQKNPIALLNEYLRQCEHETEKVRKLLERQYLLKEEFAREHRQAAELVAKRKYQAEVAMKAEEMELYEFAVKEQQHYEERSERLKLSLEHATKQLTELEQKYEEMKHKLKDMHIRRMELMGRENVTRAHHRMDQVLQSNTSADSSFSKITEVEHYLDRMEHQVNTAYFRNTIDAKIAQLEKNHESSLLPK